MSRSHYKIVNSKIIYYTKSVTAIFHQEGKTLVLEALRKEGDERRRRKRRIRVKGY